MAQIAQQDNLIVKITGDLLEELKAEGKLKEPEEEGKDNNAAKTETARRVGRPKNSEKTEV